MKLFKKQTVIPSIVFITSLIATLVSFHFISSYEDSFANSNLQTAVTELNYKLNERIELYRGVVYGALGLFNSSEVVTRQEWENFIETSKIQERFPGVLGLGYGQVVEFNNKAGFTQGIKNEGLSDFKIWPEDNAPFYVPVVYFEPMSGINYKILGYDMYSESIRRAAIDMARDSGELSITGNIELVLYPGQHSVLIYVPLYKKDAKIETVEQRRANIIGYIYSPVLFDQFIDGIKSEVGPKLDFQIFDGGDKNNLSSERLLYDSNPTTSKPGYVAKFSKIENIEWGNREWTIRYITPPGFGLSSFQRIIPWIVLILGLIFTIGLTVLVRFGIVSRGSIIKGTPELDNKLKDTLETQRLVIDNEVYSLLATNTDGLITVFNKNAQNILGYSEKEVVNEMNLLSLLSKDELEKKAAILTKKTGIKTMPDFDAVVTDCVIEGQEQATWALIDKAGYPKKTDLIIKPLYDGSHLVGYEFIF